MSSDETFVTVNNSTRAIEKSNILRDVFRESFLKLQCFYDDDLPKLDNLDDDKKNKMMCTLISLSLEAIDNFNNWSTAVQSAKILAQADLNETSTELINDSYDYEYLLREMGKECRNKLRTYFGCFNTDIDNNLTFVTKDSEWERNIWPLISFSVKRANKERTEIIKNLENFRLFEYVITSTSHSDTKRIIELRTRMEEQKRVLLDSYKSYEVIIKPIEETYQEWYKHVRREEMTDEEFRMKLSVTPHLQHYRIISEIVDLAKNYDALISKLEAK